MEPNHGSVRYRQVTYPTRRTENAHRDCRRHRLGALSLSACESQADKVAEKQADAIEATGEAKADALERQAAATPNEAVEKQLNDKADAVEKQADAVADKVEQDAGKKD